MTASGEGKGTMESRILAAIVAELEAAVARLVS